MKIKDLIKKNDYDYIEWRIAFQNGRDIFFGATASKNGKLIPIDCDIYSDQTKVLRYKEWSQPKNNIKNESKIFISST